MSPARPVRLPQLAQGRLDGERPAASRAAAFRDTVGADCADLRLDNDATVALAFVNDFSGIDLIHVYSAPFQYRMYGKCGKCGKFKPLGLWT
jgi:hypothetical protein